MKVLIAEDDPVARRLLQSYLQKWGHEVVVSVNGAEALALFQREAFPIILSDWTMPEMDGLELVRRIRASPRPGYVYFILCTARSQKEDLVAGMDAGADDFVTKPFDRDELRVRLREGERIVRLEQTAAEQHRALQELSEHVQAALTAIGQQVAALQGNVRAGIDLLSSDGASLPENLSRLFETSQHDLQRLDDLTNRLREITQIKAS